MGLVSSTGQAISIIKSGSNDNGNWIKYSNGIIICYGSKSLGNVNLTDTYGSVYISSVLQINFPITFKNIDNCVLTPESFGGGIGGLSAGGCTTSHTNFYLWHATSNILPIRVSYLAIGKWK